MSTLPVQALIFDLDDTLVNSSAAYKVALEAVGLGPDAPEFCHARALVKGRTPSNYPPARNRLLYFKSILESQGKYSPGALLSMMDHYEVVLFNEFQRQWFELNRNSLFGKLKNRFKIGLLTNENLRTQLCKLKAIDADADLFKNVIVSEEYGVEKPNSLLFQTMLRRLDCDGKRAMMIGDDFESDIVPAVRLGMSACWTREFSTLPSPESAPKFCAENIVLIVQDLRELVEFLK